MRSIIVTNKALLTGAIFWWFLFVVLSVADYNSFQILNIVGFLFLVIVPGWLSISILSLRNLEVWGYVGLAIGFSVLELMLVTLAGNSLLPLIGISHPLDHYPLLVEVSLLSIGLCGVYVKRVPLHVSVTYRMFNTTRDAVLGLFPSVFVVMSILGATRLNNGGDGKITFFMLIALGIYCAVLVYASSCKESIGKNVIPVALFFISLALLFMTSLRGWNITGHDVQREYYVFELTKNSGLWLISNFHDAYNACLSITILPTIFSKLLKFSDPYVYKVFFQIIFAVVPGLIYITFRRYVSNVIAFLSTIYFISFPTFFGDMPMLNRQEIAFLFLALMIYCIFDRHMSLFVKRSLFVVFGFGMVLSHYSTTYTVIALLIFLIVIRTIEYSARGLSTKLSSLFSESAIEGIGQYSDKTRKPFITVKMVAIVIAASFLWSSVLTDTSSNSITRVVTKTFEVMLHGAGDDTRSGDVLYSLFSWKKLNTAEIFKNYQDVMVAPARTSSPETYYDSSSYQKYDMSPVGDVQMPLTSLGEVASRAGIHVSRFNYFFRQASAKVLQVLILVGLVFVLVRRNFNKRPFHFEFLLFAVGSLILVLSQVVLPVVSAEYGVLRAFQQSLMFLGVFIVIGSLALFSLFKRNIQIAFTAVLSILFLFSTTGVLTQALGGYPAQLHLNNAGNYYDWYYAHKSELAAIDWLAHEVPKGSGVKIQSDRSDYQSFQTVRGATISKGVYPGIVERNAYVFLGYTNITQGISTIAWNGDAIVYKLPKGFFDGSKNLLYNNGQTAIYK